MSISWRIVTFFQELVSYCRITANRDSRSSERFCFSSVERVPIGMRVSKKFLESLVHGSRFVERPFNCFKLI